MPPPSRAKIEISGTYFDFTTGDGLPAGLRDVNLTFSLTETVGDLVVNGADNLTGKSAECDTDNFRELYKLLLQKAAHTILLVVVFNPTPVLGF